MIIEFVEPRVPSRRAWIIAGIPWVLVLMLAILFVYLQAKLARQRDAQIAAQAAVIIPPPIVPPHVVPPYQDEATAALKRAALPEADALAELEHVAVVGIQLRSIDVNPAASAVIVELEATSDEVLGDYLDQLNAGMPTPKWHIRRVAAMADTQSPSGGAPQVGASSSMARSATVVRDI